MHDDTSGPTMVPFDFYKEVHKAIRVHLFDLVAEDAPAMNVEDRVEMLGGMRAVAPPEVFASVLALLGDVVPERDVNATLARLDIDAAAAGVVG